MRQIQKWGVVELSFHGKTCDNPFTGASICGIFRGDNECVQAAGFYDGDGIYRVRFMPSFEGAYTYHVFGSFSDEVYDGSFVAAAPEKENHGPVRVNGLHFAYEDGTPYRETGTTCYAWTHQTDVQMQKTLQVLSEGYFNKVRFCIFPKFYVYNRFEPVTYPYEGTPCKLAGINLEKPTASEELLPHNAWDFTRFQPEHFRRIDRAIENLQALGIEADLILMHPYDCWGFSSMPREADELYLNYVAARFSAYRNVWWSMANEWDLLKEKSITDWERCAEIIVAGDPYRHLRSIHHCFTMYDHARPWITHCSVQGNPEKGRELRQRFRKPVVFDEMGYEGNIEWGWGSNCAEDLVHRFWCAAVSGCYAGHGETYHRPEGILWWSHGTALYGESQARIRFLKSILEDMSGNGLEPCQSYNEMAAKSEAGHVEYYLYYFGSHRPLSRGLSLTPQRQYRVELIDTWEMTVDNLGVFDDTFRLELPGKPRMALRIRSVN